MLDQVSDGYRESIYYKPKSNKTNTPPLKAMAILCDRKYVCINQEVDTLTKKKRISYLSYIPDYCDDSIQLHWCLVQWLNI
jgi:hypothetical protein